MLEQCQMQTNPARGCLQMGSGNLELRWALQREVYSERGLTSSRVGIRLNRSCCSKAISRSREQRTMPHSMSLVAMRVHSRHPASWQDMPCNQGPKPLRSGWLQMISVETGALGLASTDPSPRNTLVSFPQALQRPEPFKLCKGLSLL